MSEYHIGAAIEGLLKKYCKFLPVEIKFGSKKDWVDTDEKDEKGEVNLNEFLDQFNLIPQSRLEMILIFFKWTSKISLRSFKSGMST